MDEEATKLFQNNEKAINEQMAKASQSNERALNSLTNKVNSMFNAVQGERR